MLLTILAAAQLGTFFGAGARTGEDEAQATVTAITHYCLPLASDGASGTPPTAFTGVSDLPARLRYPLDSVVPRDWSGSRAVSVPSRNGEVWVVAFDDGRCMVRAWGNVLVPVSSAVHALFRESPWRENPNGVGWTATFTPKKGSARGVMARYTGDQSDNVDVQGDSVILLTPTAPIGQDNGFTFRTRHP